MPVNKSTNEKSVATQKVRQEIDKNRIISLKNCTQGNLIYISKQSGMQTQWSESGEIQYMPFSEIITMNGSQPVFLKYPWIIISEEEDTDVVEFLGLTKLYETILPPEEVHALFTSQPNEIEAKLSKVPVGNKRIIAEKAREAMESGMLDSNRVIRALESALNIDLSIIQE